MTPRTDPRIPELYSLTEAAELLDCSKNWITKLHQTGRLTGRHVGRTFVLAAVPVRALAAARRNGQTGWELPYTATLKLLTALPKPLPGLVLLLGDPLTVPVPDLLSTTEAAEGLGLAQRVWIGELYRRGEIPGRLVGRRNVVFAAETIAEVAEERRIGLHRYLS